MEWQMALLLIIGSFLLLMLAGIPVVYSFFLVNMVTMFILMGGQAGLRNLITSIYGSLAVFVLLPIPLFVLMGEIMFRTGIAQNMLDVVDKWMGRIPGRMSLIAVVGGTMLGALSGASIGTTAMLGSTLVHDMEEKGYSKQMSLGPILGSGGLAIMIPPTGLGVILAVIAKVSIGHLLIAIIVPGFLLAIGYALYIIIRCWLQPHLAPPVAVTQTPLKEKILLAIKYVLPLSSIIFVVVVLIFLGVATPTESAALGCTTAFILAAAYRKLTFSAVHKALNSTLNISVMVLTILAGGQAYSQVLAYSGASRQLINWAVSLDLAPLSIIFIMIGLTLVLGMFIGGIALMLVTIPIFMPIVEALGFNAVWFAVIMLLCIEMAQTTPPFGILLFVMKGVAPVGTTIMQIINSAIPFLIVDALVLVIMVFVPQIVLALPGLS